MSQSMTQAGRTSARALSPLNDSIDKLNKGKASFRDIGNIMQNQQGILRRHAAAMRQSHIATGQFGQAATVAGVAATAKGNAVSMAGLKFRLFNTVVHEGSRALVNWGKNTQWAGRQVTVGITVPLLLLGRAATRVAEEYDAAMVRVTKVTQFSADMGTAAYEQQVQALETRIDKMAEMAGRQFAFGPQESGGVMAEFAQMGFRGSMLDTMTEETLRLAFVSGTELPDAVNVARITLQAYGHDYEEVGEQMARFNIIENNTALSVAEISKSLPIVASVAAQLNISAAETAGLIAMQKEAGIEASEGAQALRTSLIRLVQEATDPAIRAFEKVNVNLEQMQEDNAGDTLGFLQELGEEFNKVEPGTLEMDQFIAAIGKLAGTRQAARLTAVLSQIPDIANEGTDAFRIWQGATMDAADAMAIFEAEYDRLANSASGTAERLRAAIQVQLAQVGKPVLELMNILRRSILNILEWFNQLDDGMQKTILTTLGLLGAIGPLGMFMGITANAIGSVTKAFTSLMPRLTQILGYTTKQVAAEHARIAATKQAMVVDMQYIKVKGGVAAANIKLAQSEALVTGSRAVSPIGPAVAGPKPKGRVAGAAGVAGRAAGRGSGMLARGGFFSKLAGSSKVAGAVGGAATGGILVAASMAMKTLVTDTESFRRGFQEVAEGPIKRIQEAFQSLMGSIRNVFDPITSRQAGEAMRSVSEAIGTAAGHATRFAALMIEQVGVAIEIVVGLLTAMVRGVQALAALMVGDNAAAAELWREAWQSAIVALADQFADFFDFLSNTLGANTRWGERILGGLDTASNSLRQMARHHNEAREAASANREMHQRIADTMGELDNAFIDARQNGDALIEVLTAAGRKVPELVPLTDKLEEIDAAIAKIAAGQDIELSVVEGLGDSAERRINALYRQNILTQIQRDDLLGHLEIVELIARAEQQRLVISARAAELEAIRVHSAGLVGPAIEGSVARSAIALEKAEAEAKDIRAEIDAIRAAGSLVTQEFDDWSDSLDDAEQKAAMYASRMRSEVSAVMSEVQSAVMEQLQAQNQAMREMFQQRQEDLRNWRDAETERINDTAELERERIEDVHDAKIEALQEEQEEESELEKFRQYVFERERARLNYFASRTQKQINMEVAIARGDLGQAAILREQIGSDSLEFTADNRRREESREAERRAKERQEEIDLIEERRDVVLSTLEEETEAQLEAVEQQAEQRESALEREQKAAEKAADANQKLVERRLREFQRTTAATEEEWDKHLGQLSRDLGAAGVEWDGVMTKFSRDTGNNIEKGFTRAFENARIAIAEDDKWEEAGEAIMRMFGEGAEKGLEEFLDLDPNGNPRHHVSRPGESDDSVHSSNEAEVPPNVLHGGGKVFGKGGPGLKPDEVPIIGQSGEYMIQRDAVKKLGTSVLDKINNAHKYHSGGEINFDKARSPKDVGYLLGAAFGHDGQAQVPFEAATKAMREKYVPSGAGPGGDGFSGGTGALGQFLGSGRFSRGGNWPSRQWAQLASNTRAAQNFWRGRGNFPDGIGSGVHRGVEASDHSWGKALDFMVARLGQYARGDQVKQGWDVANWHVKNPGVYGTKNVIWQKLINKGQGWENYTRYGANPGPTLGHYDHVHVSYLHDGGAVGKLDPSKIGVMSDGGPFMDAVANKALRGVTSNIIQGGMPQLDKGGHVRYDNVVANLHRGETVLTEDLSTKLMRGIEGMGSGGGATIVQIENFHGTEANIDKLAKRLEQVHRKNEVRRGARRTMK